MNKTNIPMYVLLALLVAVSLIPIANAVKLALMFLILVLILFFNRGSFYYANANKYYRKKTEEDLKKAYTLYKKAYKVGVNSRYEVTIGSVAIQCGDMEFAKTALTHAINTAGKKEKHLISLANTALSMAYWIEGNLDEAIRICESSYDQGYKDANLYINLSTYYLEKENLKDFNRLMREYSQSNIKSSALTDIYAAYNILNGNWKKAYNILTQLLDGKDYSFSDPYVHMAQIKLYYGKINEAISYLEQALEKAIFTKTAVIKEDMIKEFIAILKDRKSGAILAINKNPLSLVNGKIPHSLPDGELEFELFKEDEIIPDEEDEDEEPNLELTEADERWLKKQGLD